MSVTRITAALRKLVSDRAGGICEYCLLHEADSAHGFHVDHVISEKHEGPTLDHNLALCCPFCNRAKGSDIGGLVDGTFVRLFNPRIDLWSEHMMLVGDHIEGRTAIGGLTVRLLGFNDLHRIELRAILIQHGFYPSEAARSRMKM